MNKPLPGGSVTRWLVKLKDGSPTAVQPLWDEYFARLVALARAQLRSGQRDEAADEEDVALSAFVSFCRGVAAGRFPRLDDRDDLWQVLLVITTRKAAEQVRHETREKRSGGAPSRCPSARRRTPHRPPKRPQRWPTRARASSTYSEGAANCATVAVWKLEGYTNAEIAALPDRSVSAVSAS